MDGSDTPEPGSGLIPRATIYELEASRNRAIEAFGEGFDAMDTAHKMVRAAGPSGRFDLPALTIPSHDSGTWEERQAFNKLPDRDKYMGDITKRIDRGVWSHLISATNLDKLMDRTERDLFHQTLRDNPPPATAENCLATMERLMGDANLIFKRGIALAFAKLDRRFRSHDGFKVGSRVVLSYAYNGWSWTRGQDDTLFDVERTFCQLDGKPQPERYGGGVLSQISAARGRGTDPKAFEVDTEYFLIRVFKNHNVHLWMKRKDLVERVNLLLADYYGANLGEGPDAATPKHHAKTTMATSGGGFGLFPSPQEVVKQVMEKAGLHRRQDVARPDDEYWQKSKRVLEPSAGTGAISQWAACCMGAKVTCVEVQPHLASALAASGLYGRVVNDDFLACLPVNLGEFDVIAMNPPFDRGRDVDHVTHALRFLKPGGVLVSVMGAGVEFREDRKTADFRADVERRGGRFYDLPPASFAESGTYMNTVLCVIGRA